MRIIGLTHLEPFTGFAHDASVSLLSDKSVEAAVAEERFTKVKHYAGYPACSLNYLSKEFEATLDNCDGVALPWPPHPTYKYMLTNSLNPTISLQKLSKCGHVPKNIYQVDHHTAHAATAFRCSGWKDAAVVSIDGGGLDSGILSSGAIFTARNHKLERIALFESEKANLGIFYGAVTESLGWKYADGEGKTMGLACFGDPKPAYEHIKSIAPYAEGTELKSNVEPPACYVNIVNGRFCVEFFNETYKKIEMAVGKHGKENVAAATQRVFEEVITELVTNAVDATGQKNVCLSGGVFLNIKVNMRLREALPECRFYIPPNPGDGGSAVGSALEVLFNEGRHTGKKLEHPYLGPEYSNEEIEALLKKTKKIKYKKSSDIAEDVAKLIEKKKVVGWFQGRAEWGPRALGNRSVLSHPGDVKLKDKINLHLKRREWFMPFAPSIKLEAIDEYFVNPCESPFMIMGFQVREERRKEIAAVVHVDDTVRPHTVKKGINPKYYSLLSEFEKLSGVPAVLNTSFNRHGLPLINSPDDAIQHLLWGCVEVLSVGDFIVTKA